MWPSPRSHAQGGATANESQLRAAVERLLARPLDEESLRWELDHVLHPPPPQLGLIERGLTMIRDPWVLFGFGAQALFMARFVIQWIVSERRKRSVIPVAFWWLSLAGGVSLFTYAVQRMDPVFMFGQALGCTIYVRNLVLIARRRSRAEARTPAEDRAHVPAV